MTGWAIPDELAGELNAVRSARERLDVASAEFEEARDRVSRELSALALSALEEGHWPPIEFLRGLYWQYPEVRVKDIALVWSLHTNEVSRYAGPGMQYGECRGCRLQLERTVDNRTQMAGSRDGRYSLGWQWCDSCREVETRRLHEERAQWQVKRDAEKRQMKALMEQARREGRVHHFLVEEVDGFGQHSWRIKDAAPTT